MLTLAEYTKIGKKIISKYLFINEGAPLGFSYDELLGEIVYQLAYADLEYDPTKSTMTREKYRGQQAIIAIKQVNTRNSRYRYNMAKYLNTVCMGNEKCRDQIDVEKDNHNQSIINYAKTNSGLTRLQREHIELFLEGKTLVEISKIYNQSLSNTWQIHNNAVKKMRGVLNVGNKNDKKTG